MTTNQAPAKKPGAAGGVPGKPLKGQKKPKKPRKPMPKFMVAVITALVFLLVLAGAGACLWFNVAGLAGRAMVLFPQYRAAEAEIDKRKADVAAAEQKLTDQQEALASAQKALDKQDADLKAREEKLAADREALVQRENGVKSEEERRQAVIEVYSSMEPAKAAAMMDKANTLQEAAAILKLLPNETVMNILAEMDPKKAFELTKLIQQE